MFPIWGIFLIWILFNVSNSCIYCLIQKFSNNVDLRKQGFSNEEKYVFIVYIHQKAEAVTYFFLTLKVLFSLVGIISKFLNPVFFKQIVYY